MRSLMIAVIGANQCEKKIERLAFQVGLEIAKRGHYLICGGMNGVMKEACRGAKTMGGTTIGILPGKAKEDANPFVDIPILTALSHARNAIIVRTADAAIAVGGRYGTLSEIGLALCIDKPVFGLMTWKIPGVQKAASPTAAVKSIEKLFGRHRQ